MNNDDLKEELDECEALFSWERRKGHDRRAVPKSERRHYRIKPDWQIIWLYVCTGLLLACIGGYLL